METSWYTELRLEQSIDFGMPIDGIVAQQGAKWFENRKSRFRTNLTRQHHSGGCPRPPPHARGARISWNLEGARRSRIEP